MSRVAPFVLFVVFDGRIAVDEHLWDQEMLRRRLVETLACPDAAVSWGFPDAELRVRVERRDGLVASSWTCSECGEAEQNHDIDPTPDTVLHLMSEHWCSGSVTGSLGDEARAVSADFGLDAVVSDEEWEALPSRPVSPAYTEAAAVQAALDASEAFVVDEDFWSGLELADVSGVAL